MNIEITTIIGCSNKCSYCPQDKLKVYKGEKKLSYDNFKRLLSNIPKDVDIFFAGFSEPFLNSESSLMMAYAIRRGYKVVLYTTLVGFNFRDVKNLNDLEFAVVCFHRIKDYEKEFNIKKDIFRKCIETKRWAEEIIWEPLSRAGNLWDVKPNGNTKCSISPFDHNVVLPNGNVYLCCMDYSLTEKLGNLFETPFKDLERKTEYKLCQKCELSCK